MGALTSEPTILDVYANSIVYVKVAASHCMLYKSTDVEGRIKVGVLLLQRQAQS